MSRSNAKAEDHERDDHEREGHEFKRPSDRPKIGRHLPPLRGGLTQPLWQPVSRSDEPLNAAVARAAGKGRRTPRTAGEGP